MAGSENPRIAAAGADLVQTSAPWHLDRIDQRAATLDDQYTRIYTGSGVNIYVIDSGILETHPELAGRVYWGYTAIMDGRGITDCYGHGTAVASVAAGTTLGVASEALVTAVRVNDCVGGPDYDDWVAGIDFVAEDVGNNPIPSVVTISLGTTDDPFFRRSVKEATEALVAEGVPVVAAAGQTSEGGEDACNWYPVGVDGVIGVGASTASDERWKPAGSLSGRGSNWGACVDLWAPGTNITVAALDGNTRTDRGTSFSTPAVAGALALYIEADATRTTPTLVTLLENIATVIDVDPDHSDSPNLLLHAPELSAGINGPTEVYSDSTYTWSRVLYGDGGHPATYEWFYRPAGGSYQLVSTTATYTRTFSLNDPDFDLMLRVYIGTVEANSTKSVLVDPFTDPCEEDPLVCVQDE